MNEDEHIVEFIDRYYVPTEYFISEKYKKYFNNEKEITNHFTISSINLTCYLYINKYNIIKIGSLLSSKYYIYYDISNMLYKIHNPNYYRKYNHKELI